MSLGHEHFMRLALEEAARGGAEGNHAVGSVVTRDEAVTARGRNLEASTLDPTAHAETVALRQAAQELRRLDLSGYTLYTTAEPCPMCLGAMMASGVTTLVMGARLQPGTSRWGPYAVEKLIELTGWDNRLLVVTGVLPDECRRVRQAWDARNARPTS
jgi:tRNA(adenine34) deaminase